MRLLGSEATGKVLQPNVTLGVVAVVPAVTLVPVIRHLFFFYPRGDENAKSKHSKSKSPVDCFHARRRNSHRICFPSSSTAGVDRGWVVTRITSRIGDNNTGTRSRIRTQQHRSTSTTKRWVEKDELSDGRRRLASATSGLSASRGQILTCRPVPGLLYAETRSSERFKKKKL